MPQIFYSWQSDSPNNTNRGFIKEALEKAISNLNKEDIYEPQRGKFVLDHDTKGVSGAQAIDDTIFRKIESSDIFIADVSLMYSVSKKVGNNEAVEKFSPNPNVMLELGFAAHCLGWDRVICICNSAYGGSNKLPFDLSKRIIMFYDCSSDEENKAAKKNELCRDLKLAITGITSGLKPKNINKPATFEHLESFYQKTINSIEHNPGIPYQEVYMGPEDQHLLSLDVTQLESIIQKAKVKIYQFGGFEFLLQQRIILTSVHEG